MRSTLRRLLAFATLVGLALFATPSTAQGPINTDRTTTSPPIATVRTLSSVPSLVSSAMSRMIRHVALTASTVRPMARVPIPRSVSTGFPLTPQRVSVTERDLVFAEPEEVCEASPAVCPDEAGFVDATAAGSLAIFFVADVTARGVDVESAVTAESGFAVGGTSSPVAQEQSRSAAGTRTLGRMQSCV